VHEVRLGDVVGEIGCCWGDWMLLGRLDVFGEIHHNILQPLLQEIRVCACERARNRESEGERER